MQQSGISLEALGDVEWRKGSRSNSQGNCVMVAALPDGDIAVHDSKHPQAGAHVYTRAELGAFVKGAKDGEFDDLI